jgi:uncharacterized protein YggE
MSSRLSCLIGLVALALCIATVSAQDNSLRVIGVGTVQVPADTAIILVRAENYSDNATLAAAMASELLNSTERSLIAAGVKKEEIMSDRSKGQMTFQKWICNKVNNNTTCNDVVRNASIEQMVVKLKISDINQTQKVIGAAESAGAKAAIVRYNLSDSSSAIAQARKKALDDAKARAEEYASSLGFKLGTTMAIEEPTYPDIEIGTSYGWDMPWKMNHMFWRSPFSRMGHLFEDDYFGDDYVPEGVAEVTAYVRVTYKVGSA